MTWLVYNLIVWSMLLLFAIYLVATRDRSTRKTCPPIWTADTLLLIGDWISRAKP